MPSEPPAAALALEQSSVVQGGSDITNSHERGHLDFLDGVRGWLAVWVFLGHVASAVNFEIPVLDSPAKAVDLFMFVSGFLMMYHYRLRQRQNPWESPRTWTIFWTRRFFRIAPVYYLLLTISLMFGGYFLAQQTEFLRDAPWAISAQKKPIDALLHYTFIFGLWPKHAATSPLPDWSISLEMQFYAAFPFLVLAMRKFGLLTLAVSSVAVTAICTHWLWGVYSINPPKLLGLFPQPSFLPLKVALFVSGMISAEALAQRSRSDGFGFLFGAAAILVAALTASKLVAATIALLVAILLLPKLNLHPAVRRALVVTRAILASRLGAFLGDRSYGVYLSHLLILFPVGLILDRLDAFRAGSPSFRFAVLAAATAAVLYPLTSALSWAVERPGIEFGRQLIKRQFLA